MAMRESAPPASAVAGAAAATAAAAAVGPPLVAVYCGASVDYMRMTLAVLAAGCAFLPLDPAWPAARLAAVLQLAAPALLLLPPPPPPPAATHPGRAGGTTSATAPDGSSKWQQVRRSACCPVVEVGPEHWLHPPTTPAVGDNGAVSELGLAYPVVAATVDSSHVSRLVPTPMPYFAVLYTSGSTGVPLGVRMGEAAWLARLRWMQRRYPLRPLQPQHHLGQQQQQQLKQQQQQEEEEQTVGAAMGEAMRVDGGGGSVVCFSTAVSFVDHLWQLLAPLAAAAAAGAAAGPCSVVIPPPECVLQPGVFVELLVAHGVTHLVSVPSILRLLLPALSAARSRLRLQLLVSSGEPLAVAAAAELRRALPPGAALLNLYGSTEVTADCTWFEVPHDDVDVRGAAQRRRLAPNAGAATNTGTWVPAGWPLGDTQILIAPPLQSAEPGQQVNDGGSSGGTGPQRVAVEPLPAGEVGEVWVSGSCLSPGYHLSPAEEAATAAAAAAARFVCVQLPAAQVGRVVTAAGVVPRAAATYFRTGDVGYITPPTSSQLHVPASEHDTAGVGGISTSDPSAACIANATGGSGDGGGSGGGCLVLLGRLDAQLKLAGGVRLNLSELEAALASHPDVAEAAAVLLPRPPPHSLTSGMAGASEGANSGAAAPPAAAGGDGVPAAPPVVAGYVVLVTSQGPGAADAAAARAGGPSGSVGPALPLAHVRPQLEPQLRQWVEERLPARGGLQLQLLVLGRLPRNPAGKLLRGQLPPASPAPTSPLPLAAASVQPPPTSGWNVELSNQQHQAQQQQDLELEQRRAGPRKSQRGLPPAPPPSEVEVMRALVAATGLTALEATSDIFRAGATSLAAAEAAGLLGIDVRLLLAYPTARRLAAALRAGIELPAAPEGEGGGSLMDSKLGETDAGGASEPPATKRARLGEAAAAAAAAGPGPKTEMTLQAPLVSSAPASAVSILTSGADATAAAADAARSGGAATVACADEPGAATTSVVTVGPAAALRLREAVRNCQRLIWRSGAGRGGELVPTTGAAAAATTGNVKGHATSASEGARVAQTGVAVHTPPASGHADVQAEAIRLLRPHGCWRYQLGRCVDAPVIHLSLVAPCRAVQAAEVEEAQPQGQLRREGRTAVVEMELELVLACSHDGDVACLDAGSGLPYWHVRLPARAEAGMAVAWGPGAGTAAAPDGGPPPACAYTRMDEEALRAELAGAIQELYVVVACGDGRLYSLRLQDGMAPGAAPALAATAADAGARPTVQRSTVAAGQATDGKWAVDCGGEFKCAPVTDPWLGCVWATGHGRALVVMRPPAQLLARYEVGAPMSTPVAFAELPAGAAATASPAITAASGASGRAATGQTRQGLALLTALNGGVTALRVRLSDDLALSSTAAGARCRFAEQVWLEPLWTVHGHAPVFSAPLLVAMRMPMATPAAPALVREGNAAVTQELIIGDAGSGRPGTLAVIGHVDGCVRALWADAPLAGSCGTAAKPGAERQSERACAGGSAAPTPAPSTSWSLQLRGNLFADLVLLPHPDAEAGDAAAESRGLWPRGSGMPHGKVALAATHAGLLYGIDVAFGQALWHIDLQCGPISAAPAAVCFAVSGAAVLPAGVMARRTLSAGLARSVAVVGETTDVDAVVAVLASSGSLAFAALGVQGRELLACVQGFRMPAETFSSPAVTWPALRAATLGAGQPPAPPVLAELLFGCRDDCVYSVKLQS
ncbi:hypothetical protein HYH02_001666 [Chlamydomonas schloesseri]|uniref:AMP-dependent synthetase/ligase domain-containing protein n=1 Tax=Chlamydomonas schloesseri TaxID=2026947 RepID=A0A835WTH9_9CHLO|nr:hypothetical protein HYH02_001666 [Chlamydomonas schloesseri]|eukprot:KAG2453445.1 hypothetical protein HYH02_001666 [Chlamydomonas schloesseri]